MDFIKEDHTIKTQLESACSDLRALLHTSAELETSLSKIDKRFVTVEESLLTLSKRVAPIQSLAIARKALETRLNRAISPALALLDSFKLCESLQSRLVQLSSGLSVKNKNSRNTRLNVLLKYVHSTDQLTKVIGVISREGEAAIHKLQEVVEFLSRTKATDQYRTHRLRETLVTLKALYETEVDGMKFDGLLDEALMILQDEFEWILERLRHPSEMVEIYELGSEVEVEVMKSIVETLTENDCLDICIDIFVKMRYRRAAKALMNLNPDYLKTYNPEEVDEMEWETLETAITLWIEHFEVAVRKVFVAEKILCDRVLSSTMEVHIWTECFVKIADKIMAVFFRFGEGVARSNKEPQKLFKLLDMFESLQKLRHEFSETFECDAGEDICARYREPEKLLIHASSKVFWEFGLQIEGSADGLNPPHDGSVSKMVRYVVNYIKYLTTDMYKEPMIKVLETEQMWKMGILPKPDLPQDGLDLFKDAISNILDALKRYVEMKKTRYKDNVLPHIFAMNTYWYIYMRSRNTEVGKLLGDQWMKNTFKVIAEESAYMYQKQAWGSLVHILEIKEDTGRQQSREAIEGFMRMFKHLSQAHKTLYNIQDFDLREQIRGATINYVMPVYAEFVEVNSFVLKGRSYLSVKVMEEAISRVFECDRPVIGSSGYRKQMG